MIRMHNPPHPGEVLREYIPEGLAVAEVARRLGVTRQALSAVLNGRADVGADMALRLEAALGTTAEMWMQMQSNHALWKARQQGKPKVQRLALRQLSDIRSPARAPVRLGRTLKETLKSLPKAQRAEVLRRSNVLIAEAQPLLGQTRIRKPIRRSTG